MKNSLPTAAITLQFLQNEKQKYVSLISLAYLLLTYWYIYILASFHNIFVSEPTLSILPFLYPKSNLIKKTSIISIFAFASTTLQFLQEKKQKYILTTGLTCWQSVYSELINPGLI